MLAKSKTKFLKRTFGCSGATLWSNRPQELKLAESISSFNQLYIVVRGERSLESITYIHAHARKDPTSCSKSINMSCSPFSNCQQVGTLIQTCCNNIVTKLATQGVKRTSGNIPTELREVCCNVLSCSITTCEQVVTSLLINLCSGTYCLSKDKLLATCNKLNTTIRLVTKLFQQD